MRALNPAAASAAQAAWQKLERTPCRTLFKTIDIDALIDRFNNDDRPGIQIRAALSADHH